MAFPTVVNSATSSATTDPISVTMPASLVAGRLLLLFIGSNQGEAGNTLSGWTNLGNVASSPTGTTIYAFAKVATGSDTASYSGGGTPSRCAIVYQIDNWWGDLTKVTGAVSANNLATLDPPNLAVPSADDYLWVTAAVSLGSVTGAPTNYSNFLSKVQSPTTLGSAQRTLNASSENPGVFAGTATSPEAVTVAVGPVEVFGPITFQKANTGALAYSITNPAVPYPSSLAANNLIVLLVGQKPATANGGGITTPAGFTLVGSLASGDTGGYGATLAADTGNVNLYVYTKVATGSESGNLTVTTADNSVAFGQMYRLSNASGNWNVAAVFGSDITAGNVSITGGSDPGVTAEDYILGAMCIPTDVTTPAQFSAEAFSQTGVTFGTVQEISEPDTTLGNQIGGFTCRARVLSGTSSAAPVMTATAGGTTTNVRGPGVFIRIRESTTAAYQPPVRRIPFVPALRASFL